MNRIEILKSFMSDEILKEKFGFSDDEINKIDLITPHSKIVVDLLRQFISMVEDGRTERVASSNLHTYLENQLRQK